MGLAPIDLVAAIREKEGKPLVKITKAISVLWAGNFLGDKQY
jgi:hypothetical protein